MATDIRTHKHTHTQTHILTLIHTRSRTHTYTDKYDYMAKLGTYVSNKDLECKIYGEKIEFKIVKSEKRQY